MSKIDYMIHLTRNVIICQDLFDSGEQEEYLWREIDRVQIKNLEKNMKVFNSISNIIEISF